MKKVIETAAAKSNLQTAYAGSTRIMYLKGDDETIREFIRQARINYPNLAFQLKNGNQVEQFNEIAAKELKVAPPERIVLTEESTTADLFAAIHQRDQDNERDAEAYREVIAAQKKKPTPQEVDDYLLANPIDRKAKGPYNAAAKHFDVKPDYIRGRWARLREQGLVEKELQTENA